MQNNFDQRKQNIINHCVYVIAKMGVSYYGHYGPFLACVSSLDRANDYINNTDNIIEYFGDPDLEEKDKEDRITEQDIIDCLNDDKHIIPVFGLDKKRIIYVHLTDNCYYKGISNYKEDFPQDKGVIREYDFKNQ